jgi:DNA-binding NarL/FixJ family response regulator
MTKVLIADDHPTVVSTYRTCLLKKLNLKTNTEIIRYAIENGLIE